METPCDDSNVDGSVPVPPLLYKYANWRKDYHRRLITHREIFFASARGFNDPFDSAIPLRYDLMTPNQELEFLKRMIPLEIPNARQEEVVQLAEERIRNQWLRESKNSERVKERQQELMYQTIGLFSVTEVPDSILMWSYYADGHSGFCVGYDQLALTEYINLFGDTSPLLFDKERVLYSAEYLVLNPGELDDRQYFLMRTHIKSLEWKHEREWRFVVFGTTDYALELPSGMIKQVILGCRVSDAHKDEIMAFARDALEPSVTFWQTKPMAGKFGLELVQFA